MAKLERMYNVPLRSEYLKVPTHRRAKKSVKALAEFIARHMHAELDNVRITTDLNNFIWKHGMKNPPHHVKVNAVKEDNGMVMIDLADKVAKKERSTKQKKVEAPKVEHKKEDHAGHKHEEKKADKPKSEHKPAAKKK